MGGESPHLKPVPGNDSHQIWSALQEVNKQLLALNDKFLEVIRIEEKVNHHRETLARFGTVLDNHELTLRDHRVELARLDQSEELGRLRRELKALQGEHVDAQSGTRYSDGYTAGRRDIVKAVTKWGGALAAGYILFLLTSEAEASPPDAANDPFERTPVAVRKKEDIWP